MSSINKSPLSWNDSISSLIQGKRTAKLISGGVQTLWDLLWLFPLRVQETPTIQSFHKATPGQLFKGVGKVISFQTSPAFRGRRVAQGKGGAILSRCKMIVESFDKKERILLTWFNVYPNLKKKLENFNDVEFMGMVSTYQGKNQIANPKVSPPDESREEGKVNHLMREYPTVNGVSGKFIQAYLDKIPSHLWNSIEEKLPISIIQKRSFTSLKKAFLIIHGLVYKDDWDKKLFKKAKMRIVYEEFFQEQMKIISRRNEKTTQTANIIKSTPSRIEELKGLLPYQLTPDQEKSFHMIQADLLRGSPMMRMVQGDVGSGKTTIALLACTLFADQGFQSAIMCPTEALALQHLKTAKEVLGKHFHIESLLGSHREKEKKEIVHRLSSGKIQIIIGTHSLFQKKVKFNNLQFIVIDEQHKFGVNQRISLTNKGQNPHTLTMTATPIPRSLCLTQYGDLDISIIKSIPMGRKGTQTRIIHNHLMDKYLSFLKTRLEMGEQAYIVAPAIEESETLDIENVTSIFEKYREYFPKNSLALLHGRLKPEEKEDIFYKFLNREVDILISTSVIEVGINNTNATVISIYNPERFGLSSLHQLRGRVGRGGKPGFCFLLCDENISKDSLERIEIIERTNDGFEIAEEDLKQRGQGDLFGSAQSGLESGKRLANIAIHGEVLNHVIDDIQELNRNHHEIYLKSVTRYNEDDKVQKTI